MNILKKLSKRQSTRLYTLQIMAYHQIVEKQRAYFKAGKTRCLSKRKETLNTFKKLLEENGEELIQSIYTDLHRSGQIDVYSATMAVNECLAKLEEWNAPKKLPSSGPLNEHDDLYVVKEPLGVVLSICPWNFPLATAVPIIAALAAGNTVVLKPSELNPTYCVVIEKLIKKYFDESLLTVVNGAVPETTELLKERFDYIIYTGCPPVAKIVMAAAAKHLTPVTLELGGKNPTVVLDDADIESAAKKIVAAKMLNCGQICINPDYFLTTEKTKPLLLHALKNAWEEQGVLKENPAFARIVNERHFDRLSALLEKTKGKVAWKSGEAASREEKFLPPTVVDIDKDDELMKDEIFGTVMPLVTVADFDEAIKIIQDNEKPLSAYLFSKCPKNAERFIRETWSGGVTVNDVQAHAFAPGVPFGGVGNSGMGRINGKYSFDTFTHEKTVLLRDDVGKKIDDSKL